MTDDFELLFMNRPWKSLYHNLPFPTASFQPALPLSMKRLIITNFNLHIPEIWGQRHDHVADAKITSVIVKITCALFHARGAIFRLLLHGHGFCVD